MLETRPDTLQNFMNDPRVVEMCELQRISDDLLDVLSLKENDHSDILYWLFDTREGHGQGDEILRDLLAHASERANRADCKLAKSRSTSKFFHQWPAARIRTTSFGAAFGVREFPTSDGRRLDLAVIDPQNKFILVIENKSGTPQTTEQLDAYRISTDATIKSTARLREYTPVYLALDRYYLEAAPKTAQQAAQATWLHLSYDWLKNSSMRAQKHLERGNAAARLVVSYCGRQTGQEGKDDARMTELAVELHVAYPQSLGRLLSIDKRRLAVQWLTRNADEELLVFLLQNPGVAIALEITRGMTAFAAALSAQTGIPLDNIHAEKSSVTICPQGWEDVEEEEVWPVYFYLTYADQRRERVSVVLVYREDWLASTAAPAVRKVLVSVAGEFSKMGKRRSFEVALATDVDQRDALQKLDAANKRLAAASRRLSSTA